MLRSAEHKAPRYVYMHICATKTAFFFLLSEVFFILSLYIPSTRCLALVLLSPDYLLHALPSTSTKCVHRHVGLLGL